ncbi:MAG: hypothetical protein R6U94_12895 [Nitriliruptoraceae bacterium]
MSKLMDGWKAVVRTVDEPVLLDTAVERVEAKGFEQVVRNPAHVLLRRDGTQWTLRGERAPLELTLAESDDGVFLQLRYDTFVAFDTGDLEEYADELASAVRG